MRKIKRNKLAVSAFALAASASLLFAGNVFAAFPGDVGEIGVGGASGAETGWVAYTAPTGNVIDTSFTGVRTIEAGSATITDLRYFENGYCFKTSKTTGLKPYTGVTGTKFAYIKDGAGFAYDGIAEYEGVKYYVSGGFVDQTTLGTSNTIVKDGTKEYLINKGVVDTSFTGLVQLDTSAATATETAKVINKDMITANFGSSSGQIAKIVYVENGVVSTTYEGFAELKGVQYYVVKGVPAVKTTLVADKPSTTFLNSVRKLGDSWVILKEEDATNQKYLVAGTTQKADKSGILAAKSEFGLNPYTNNAYIVKNGVVDFSCNELHKVDPAESTTGAVTAAYDAFFKTTSAGATAFDNKLLKVTNGKLDFKYTDFCTYKYVENITNLKKEITFFLVDGQLTVDPDFDGCVRPLGDDWVYVEDASITDKDTHTFTGAALYVKNTATNKKYTGLAINPYTKDVYYVKDNKVDFTYGNVYCVNAAEAGIIGGAVTNGDLVKFTRGKYRDSYTGFGTYEYVDEDYGISLTKEVYFDNGKTTNYAKPTARPLGDGSNTWVVVNVAGCMVDRTFTGLAENPYTHVLYYAKNGVIDFSFNGTFDNNGTIYKIVNGKATAATIQ